MSTISGASIWRGLNAVTAKPAKTAASPLAGAPGSEATGGALEGGLARLKEMQSALERLRKLDAGPKPATKSAMNKLGLLRQRLQMLKQMLLNASPRQAKALAQELKSIASELKSAAGALPSGGGSGGDVLAGLSLPADAAGSSAMDTAAAQAAEASVDTGIPAAGLAEDASAADGGSVSDKEEAGRQDDAGKPAGEDEDAAAGNAMRAMISDLKKMLAEAIALLKRKLAQGDQEAKKALQDAQSTLAKIPGFDSLSTSYGGDGLPGGEISLGVSVQA